MKDDKKGVKRRKFLKYSGVGLGLMIGGVWLVRNPIRRAIFKQAEKTILPYAGDTSPLLWIQVTPDNNIIVKSSKVEMGQGTFTALAQLVAEELEVDFEKISVVHADTSSGSIDLFGTGGSLSVPSLWVPLREMAATMRVMLKTKASEKLGVGLDKIKMNNGVFSADGKSITFGAVVKDETDWVIPDIPPLKEKSDFKYIGKALPRVDLHDKVIGSPIFGMDAMYPDMLYGSVVRSRLIDAKMSNFDTSEAEKMPGVVQVIQENGFIGVVAKSQVEADNARQKISFDYTPNKIWNLSDIKNEIKVGNGKKTIIQKEGSSVEDIEDGDFMSLEFWTAIGAHAQLEPNGAVANYSNGKLEVKISTQVPKITRDEVAKALSLSKKDVNIIPTFLGGGFGRRLHTPHVIEAATMSRAVGKPVKCFFDRKQEFQNDTFRPPSHNIVTAKIDGGGNILAMQHNIASGDTFFNSVLDPGIGAAIRADVGSIRGGSIMYNGIPNHRAVYYHTSLPFATSFWRSLGLLANTFAIESFLDEVALKTKQDPISLRLKNIKEEDPYSIRTKNVIKTCAQKAGYKEDIVNGRAMGFAASIDAGSPCAQVVEVSIVNNRIKVHKVTAVMDCGIAVNPDQVKAQVEGCICMGISAALFEKMDLKENKLYPVNYGAYRMALMKDTPKEIDVFLIEGADYAGPVGEPPLGPIGAAIGNAVRRLTGKRLTELPMSLT